MSSKAITPQPDWFDSLWEKYAPKIPIYLRNDAIKQLARDLIGAGVVAVGMIAKTPEGVRQIVAFARITSAIKAAQISLGEPNPSPERVAEFVERLVQRVKP
jgi:hypothetical protein